MPFLGQDWRSPGQSWVKTEEGWKNYSLDEKTAMTQTSQRHGYCTLGEAFNRLDFCSAIKDNRRFNYVVRLLELIAKSQLPSLSGVAQKNYMNILERVVQKVLGDQQNVRPIKELLQTLYVSLCGLVQDMGKSVLVGNINCWVHRMENILQWQQQLDNIQINRPVSKGMTLTDLPASLQLNIMERLSDGRDLVSLGQVTPDLGQLTEDRLLWKRLCQHHFTDRQVQTGIYIYIHTQSSIINFVGTHNSVAFQIVFSLTLTLKLCVGTLQHLSIILTLQFCTHCHILFWKDTNHPCTANNTESCCKPVSPQGFINLFKF
ncbi:F-box only protein 32-like [Oncorhynchus keta]|uniref:F-box only protein 32-like n=1 Tax=Oncorhynchus keta TaxID=8018 RepID=UPI00227D4558|nr:F-box only protein 32-like [Oncorhynchus keta]